MGRKIRIVLLSVTAVAAVFSFASMLATRPGSDSTVLDAARARQSEPLLSVAEPLETDIDAITAEEEMTRKVKELLLSDEEFIKAVSDDIYEGVPELVDRWFAGEEAEAILRTLQENGVDAAIARIVTEENIDAIAERVAENLGTDSSEAYAAASERLVSAVAGSIIIPELQRQTAERAVLDFYQDNKDAIAADVIDRAVSEYRSLSVAGKAELLSLEAIYAAYGDMVSADAIAALEALPAEEKAAIISFSTTADRYYQENLGTVVEDVREALGPEESIDVEAEVLTLYDKYRSALVSDIILDIIERYDALSHDEQMEVLGVDTEADVLALYDKYGDALAEDVAAYIQENYPAEAIDLEAEVLALYGKYREGLAEDVAAYMAANHPDEPLDIEAEVLALYDEYGDALAEDVAAYISENYPDEAVDVEAAVLALYPVYREALAEDVSSYFRQNYPAQAVDVAAEVEGLYARYRDQIAEDAASYIAENYPAEDVDIAAEVESLYSQHRDRIAEDIASYIRQEYPAEEIDIDAEALRLYDEYADRVAEDVIAYWKEHYPQESPAAFVETHGDEIREQAAKAPVTPPSFGTDALLPEDAGIDEYQQLRSEIRQGEADRLNAFLAQ